MLEFIGLVEGIGPVHGIEGIYYKEILHPEGPDLERITDSKHVKRCVEADMLAHIPWN